MATTKKGLCNETHGPLTDKQIRYREDRIASHMGCILDSLDIDWRNDHNMKDTPQRFAKMLMRETFAGRFQAEPKMTTFPNVNKLDQIIVQGDIDVKSTCAHHLQPIHGRAWIGVMPTPTSRIVGLSKFNRVVDFFARRPQIQEELTTQIANFLSQKLEPAGIIVILKARHHCVCGRGVNQNSVMSTSVAYGEFRKDHIKQEFFKLVGDMNV